MKTEQPKPKRAEVKFTERVVRYPATVVTQSGYGQLALRGEPSSKGLEIGVVNDGEEVQVVARTNKCEILHSVDGCWVRVQIGAVKGYMRFCPDRKKKHCKIRAQQIVIVWARSAQINIIDER